MFQMIVKQNLCKECERLILFYEKKDVENVSVRALDVEKDHNISDECEAESSNEHTSLTVSQEIEENVSVSVSDSGKDSDVLDDGEACERLTISRKRKSENFLVSVSDSGEGDEKENRYKKAKRPCFICAKGQSQLKRHVLRKHRNQPDVIPLLVMPSREQDERIDYFRQVGIRLHNMKVLEAGGDAFLVFGMPWILCKVLQVWTPIKMSGQRAEYYGSCSINDLLPG